MTGGIVGGGVLVAVGVAVGDAVSVGVAVRVGVAVAVGVSVLVGIGVGEDVAVCVRVKTAGASGVAVAAARVMFETSCTGGVLTGAADSTLQLANSKTKHKTYEIFPMEYLLLQQSYYSKKDLVDCETYEV